jgi:hypothetical protein
MSIASGAGAETQRTRPVSGKTRICPVVGRTHSTGEDPGELNNVQTGQAARRLFNLHCRARAECCYQPRVDKIADWRQTRYRFLTIYCCVRGVYLDTADTVLARIVLDVGT